MGNFLIFGRLKELHTRLPDGLFHSFVFIRIAITRFIVPKSGRPVIHPGLRN